MVVGNKIKIQRYIIIACLLVFGLGIFVASVPLPATAATNFNFVDSNFNQSTIIPGNTTRFKFINPFTIVDMGTPINCQASNTPTNGASTCAIYSTSASNYIADDKNGSGFYWYWPGANGGSVLASPTHGVCQGALVLGFNGSTAATLYAVQPTTGNGDTSCIVTNGKTSLDPTKVTGRQPFIISGAVSAGRNTSGTSTINPDTMGAINNEGVTIGSDWGVLRAMATFLSWKSPDELDSMFGQTLSRLAPSKAYDYFVQHAPSQYTAGYNLYTNTANLPAGCTKTDGQTVAAVVAVSPSNVTQGTILHWDSVKKKYDTTWDGSKQTCIAGTDGSNDIGSSPNIALPGGNSSDSTIGLADVANYTGAGNSPNATGTTSGTAAGSGTGAPSLTCSPGANPLDWLLCAAVQGMVNIINPLANLIYSQLSVGTSGNTGAPDQIFGNGASAKDYKSAWDSFRNISLALMVIAALVVIISQAAGFEILDAYTIRKVLPRFLIVAILINLSWPLMQFFVQLTNDLGYGIRWLIYSPFSDLKASSLSGGGDFAITVVAGGAIVALGTFGLLSFAVTGALSLFVAYITLVLRQILIIFLIIIAPVAIVAYILPNTQKYYKTWWESFSKALLMFPIIAGIIAAGHAFAAVALSGPNGGSAINQFIAFAAYFGPYFMIPATFRFAGAALGAASGMINKQAQGGFKGLQGYRKSRAKGNWEKTQSGKRFKGGNDENFRGRINKGLQVGSTINNAGVDPRRWRSRMRESIERDSEQQRDHMMEDKDYTWKGDDGLNKAASASTDRNDLRRRLMAIPDRYTGANDPNIDRDVERVEKLRERYDPAAFKQATFLSAVAGGTAYTKSEIWKAAADVAGDDNGLMATLVAKGRSAAMSAGRADQGGASFGETYAIADNYRRGAYADVDAEGRSATADLELAGKALDSQGAGVLAHASMKTSSVESLVPVLQQRVRDAVASGDQDEIDRQLATVANLYDTMSASSPKNAKVLADQVLLYSVPGAPGANGAVTVQQRVEASRINPMFQTTRRELGLGQLPPGQTGPAVPGGPGPIPGAPTQPGIRP